MKNEKRIIRFPELRKRLGNIGRSTVWRWEKAGTFPKHIQLGVQSVGWIEHQIDEWISNKEGEANA